MGLLRLLLAISVLCAHSTPIAHLKWISGDTAVEVFFVISGFYMQLVLATKYTQARLGSSWIKQFYIARYLRLWPVYAIGCMATLGIWLCTYLLSGISTPPVSTLQHIVSLPDLARNVALKIFIVFTNLTMMFQDVAMFLAVKNGVARFTENFRQTDVEVLTALVVPPAWSLGIEISFYVLAPLALKWKNKHLYAMAAASILIKGATLFLVKRRVWDPLSYRFFPFELGYFFLGALAYRHKEQLAHAFAFVKQEYRSTTAYAIVALLAVSSFSYKLSFVGYPFLFALLIPFIFNSTSGYAADRAIGDLSYPFYLFHVQVFGVVSGSIERLFGEGYDQGIAVTSAAVTIVAALMAARFEDKRIEPFRRRLGRAGALTPAGFPT